MGCIHGLPLGRLATPCEVHDKVGMTLRSTRAIRQDRDWPLVGKDKLGFPKRIVEQKSGSFEPRTSKIAMRPR